VCRPVTSRLLGWVLSAGLCAALLWLCVRGYLHWTAPAVNYPVPKGCRGGLPVWWPDWLPGAKAPLQFRRP
jgi:hypothetical protein